MYTGIIATEKHYGMFNGHGTTNTRPELVTEQIYPLPASSQLARSIRLVVNTQLVLWPQISSTPSYVRLSPKLALHTTFQLPTPIHLVVYLRCAYAHTHTHTDTHTHTYAYVHTHTCAHECADTTTMSCEVVNK